MTLHGKWGFGAETECGYLRGRRERLEMLLLDDLDAAAYEILLEQGYRRFGNLVFRPFCPDCSACVPIRVSTAGYREPRSSRKTLQRAGSLAVALVQPEPTREAYAVFARHKERFRDTSPDAALPSYEGFVDSFFRPHPFSWALVIRAGDRLVGIAHVDVTAAVASAVYTYYDPDFLRFSPGSLAVCTLLRLAVERGLQWVYLGYYIAANRHMAYKARYRPNEVLLGSGGWVPFMDAANRMAVDPAALDAGFSSPGRPWVGSLNPGSRSRPEARPQPPQPRGGPRNGPAAEQPRTAPANTGQTQTQETA